MFNPDNKDCIKQFVEEWATKYGYLDDNGTLSEHVDYDVGYDMKSDILNEMNKSSIAKAARNDWCPDAWYDLFLEDTLLPILRNMGAINEDE